ncbi:MAG: hypothetical protein ABFD49_05365 [Armatimonadota bacterium]|nr:hypothetical protein [bacterium]
MFVDIHKSEILSELLDIGATAVGKYLAKCHTCGFPVRWWLNSDSRTGDDILWWICEECGCIRRERLQGDDQTSISGGLAEGDR